MDVAIRARTKADLALLVWDLPDAQAVSANLQPPKVGAWRSAAFRAHATAYSLVNGMLVGIWAITDSNHLFWPFFPIAGWGVGLGMSAVGARQAQRHKYEKEVRRLERAAQGELAAKPRKKPAAQPELDLPAVPAPPHPTPPRPTPPRPTPPDPTRPDPTRPNPTRVVVMFTDVVDSTRLTMVIGDEDWTRVRARYREMLQDCYQAYGGREVSSQGDGFLARFERPSNAVQCAVEIQTEAGGRSATSSASPPPSASGSTPATPSKSTATSSEPRSTWRHGSPAAPPPTRSWSAKRWPTSSTTGSS